YNQNTDALNKVSMLIVDDEEDARDMLAEAVKLYGAKVDCASSVDEGMDKINSGDYNLIISDIGMPDKDGYELAKEVRSHSDVKVRGKPMIALSAFARENDRKRSKEAGFSAHLAKPLKI